MIDIMRLLIITLFIFFPLHVFSQHYDIGYPEQYLDIQEFKDKGYLKESIINNLILLGWSPGRNNEIIKLNEILDLYDLKNLSKSSSILFIYN